MNTTVEYFKHKARITRGKHVLEVRDIDGYNDWWLVKPYANGRCWQLRRVRDLADGVTVARATLACKDQETP